MAYNIDSGKIQAGVLYQVYGTSGTITYSGMGYSPGSTFRGIIGTATFTLSGDATVQEVTEFTGADALFESNSLDQPVFAEQLVIRGMAVAFELNEDERIVNETTRIQGFALELIDYPFYSFEITETRL